MAKISLGLDKRKSANGKYQVRIRITNNETSAFISTSVFVRDGELTCDLHDPLDRRVKDYLYLSNKLLSIINRIEDGFRALESTEQIYFASAGEIKRFIFRDEIAIREKQKELRAQALAEAEANRIKKRSESFTGWMEKFSQRYSNEKTRRSILYFTRLLGLFNGERKNCQCNIVFFNDLTYSFLSDFETWMMNTGRGEYVRYGAFSYMRTACNEAIRRKMMDRKDNPFEDFKIKVPVMSEEIEYISEEAMRKMLSLDLRNLQGRMTMSRARDVAMISFYLCGMNLKDIFELPPQKNGEVVFVRSKIKDRKPRPVHISITPELQALIKKYAGKNYLFNFAETYCNLETFQTNLSKRLRRLSAFVGEPISMLLIRHTWATYAGKLDISDSVIDKSMGHKDNNVLSIHYRSYDWSKTDIANRKVIDYVMNGVKENSIRVPKFIRNAHTCVCEKEESSLL